MNFNGWFEIWQSLVNAMTSTNSHQELKTQCIGYYRQAAASYDSSRFSDDCSRFYDWLAKETVYGFLKDCRYVIDVGTGTGRFAVYLAQRGINVIAVDSSREMLEVAWEKAQREGCQDRITFLVADIENLPFKDGIFDGACSIHVIIHLTNQGYAIAELSRVLKVGGALVMDVPNKILSKIYRLFVRLAGKATFPDYHYNLTEIRRLFVDNSIELSGRKAFSKLPRLAVHFLVCVLKLKFLLGVIERFERLNFGGTSIIKGLKNG